jgi:hypothetical protein
MDGQMLPLMFGLLIQATSREPECFGRKGLGNGKPLIHVTMSLVD